MRLLLMLGLLALAACSTVTEKVVTASYEDGMWLGDHVGEITPACHDDAGNRMRCEGCSLMGWKNASCRSGGFFEEKCTCYGDHVSTPPKHKAREDEQAFQESLNLLRLKTCEDALSNLTNTSVQNPRFEPVGNKLNCCGTYFEDITGVWVQHEQCTAW